MMTNHHPRDEVFSADASFMARAYLENFDDVSQWYAGPYQTLDQLVERGESLLLESTYSGLERNRLSRKLSTYMRSLGAPQAALDNATLLASRDVFAIVTGQQPGLAGGPLMLVHKVAHAVKLAESLSERGVTCVPIFWAASEDHDIDEVNVFNALNRKGKLVTKRIKSLGSGTIVPLEKIKLPPVDDPQVAALLEMIPEGEHRDHAESLFRESFDCGFGQALNRLLLRLFGERGLVVLEPRLLRDLDGHKRVIEAEIRSATAHQQALRARLEEISLAGFSAPLSESPYANFFYMSRGKRRHALPQSGGFTIDDEKGARKRADMLSELSTHPDRFSPGVRLRPVVQGACLPVLAYIGGPGEIAYHSVLKPIFESCNVPMPLLIPRWSFVCAEDEADAEHFAQMREEIRTAREGSRQSCAAISETLNESRLLVSEMEKELGFLRTSLAKPVQRISQGLEKSLSELRGRASSSPLDQESVSEITRERGPLLFPSLQPQERTLNWLALWPQWRDTLNQAWLERNAMDFSVQTLIRPLQAV